MEFTAENKLEHMFMRAWVYVMIDHLSVGVLGLKLV